MKQSNFCTDTASLMNAHSRAIVHLRSQGQIDRKRVGLIIGAGVSKGIKNEGNDGSIPDWPTLIQNISNNESVKGDKLLEDMGAEKLCNGTFNFDRAKKPLSSIAQLLFQIFKENYLIKNKLKSPLPLIDERKINTKWMQLVKKNLYKGFKDETEYESAIKSHPYLSQLTELIKQIPLTINFNFDDSVERLLFLLRDDGEKLETRGYEIILEPTAQIARDKAVIYHPNGILPFVFEDGASPELVFSDDAFHDQISSIASGRNILLTNYLFSNTCILLGLSLEDISLQQTLRQNAVSHPGHPHYVIHYMGNENELPQNVRSALFKSNFDTFGVYTLFLDDGGIAALFELISMGKDIFQRDFADSGIKFVYYLIGAVGVGKSTAVKYFQSLRTYDEWVDRRLPEMSNPDNELDPKQREKVDQWVVNQFGKKNFRIAGVPEFIHIIDRCPLDPLTFGKKSERKQKAVNLYASMKQGGREIQKGHLLWLDCSNEEIAHRKSRKHKNWASQEIDNLLNSIVEVYGSLSGSKIPTHHRTAVEVARELSWIIFVEEYAPTDIDDALKKFKEEE